MVVCLFSACNDDDDDKIPQGPAITYAGKLPSRIGDYTFVYDDNNRCTQVKKNSYVYGEIDYDKGVVIMDDEEAKVSFNSDGYVTGISASWNYNEDGYSYKGSGKISFSYNGNGQLVSYIESSSESGKEDGESFSSQGSYKATYTWKDGNLIKVVTKEESTEDEEKYHENEKKLKEYQQNMIDLEKEMQEISLELNTQQMSQSAIKRRKEELDNRHEQLSIQRQQLEEELRNAEDDADRLQDEQVDLESANEQDEERIKEISEILEHLRKHAEQHAMEVSKVHMQLSKESQKLEFQENNQERVRSEIEHLSEEVQENQKDTGSINENVKALKQQIEHLKESCEVIERKIIEDQNRHQKMQEEVKEKEVLYKDILKEREEMLERISGYDKEMYRLESQRENRKGKKKELLDYMWENYEITYHQAKQRIDLDETQSLTKVKETISELKNKIKNLGPVNINAVEDYKEVSERYEFMQKQHEDIVTAEAHLTGLMEELEDAMRRQFNAKFKDIKRVFQEVFVELFGGGEARLELTDDDVLESGIRIIAQPPGKKLQNMMQLSGGEKALTAISLLFAIQNLKPSPFCLLDEIEAALDDSNVTRFAKYLHKLTKDTQFIVITHRRGTMMAADVLYGITMQEKGISTQVSVNLIENDLDE